MKTSQIKLSAYKTKQINSRSLIKNILSLHNDSKEIIVDFQDIEFISRASSHELLSSIKTLNSQGIKVSLVNKSDEINKMLDLVSKSIEQNNRTHSIINKIEFKSFETFKSYMLAI